MTEIWKDIPGYGGYYKASNFGRIKGISRKVPRLGYGHNSVPDEGHYL